MAWPTGSRATWDLKSSAFLKSGDLEEKMLEKFVLEGCENLVFFPEDSTLEKDYLQSLWTHFECFYLSERNLKTANARMRFTFGWKDHQNSDWFRGILFAPSGETMKAS